MSQCTRASHVLPTAEGLEPRQLLSGDQVGFYAMVKDGLAGVDGLAYADAVAISPDGLQIYAAGRDDNAVAVFRRDLRRGALNFLQVLKEGDDGCQGLAGVRHLAVSPDGKNVYAAGYADNSLVVFTRDLATGLLAFQQVLQDNVKGVDGLEGVVSLAVSPDGKQVYAAGSRDNAVAVFSRSLTTGGLAFTQILRDGVGGITGIESISSVTLSPDGKQVYATSATDKAVAVFSRSAATGRLAEIQVVKNGVGGVDGLDGASAAAVSPDGKQVYTTADQDNAVTVFAREAATGRLTFQQVLKNGDLGINGLRGASSLALSPDGRYVYATGTLINAFTLFTRDAATGNLTVAQTLFDGLAGVDGLAGARSVATTPDGEHVYVAGAVDNALAALVTPNRAPVLDPTGGMALTAITNDDTAGAGTLVSVIIASGGPGRITDADLQDPDGIAVTAVDNTHGDWQFTVDGGPPWTSFGTPSATEARLLPTDVNAAIRFVPAAGFVGCVADGITFRAWDRSTGVAGGTADASQTGGSTAFSAAVVTAEITVTDTHLLYKMLVENGVDKAAGEALSPDGTSLYVASSSTSTLSVFGRDPGTGGLLFLQLQAEGAGGVEGLSGVSSVTVSPDGWHVYAAAYDSGTVTVFRRDAGTGMLTFLQVIREGVGGVAGLTGASGITVSPDGKSVYVAGHLKETLAVFSRNLITGGLTYLQEFVDNTNGVDGLNGVEDVIVSPDGRFVYAAGSEEDEVPFFARDLKTGALMYIDRIKNDRKGVQGIDGVTALAISSDGQYLYTAATTNGAGNVAPGDIGAVAVFKRDIATGGLTFVQVMQDLTGGVNGLAGASALVLSPDGGHVYVSAQGGDPGGGLPLAGTLTDFRRDPVTGRLSLQQVLQEGVLALSGLAGASAVTVSPDGKWIYVAAYRDKAISIFAVLNSAPVLDPGGVPILDPVAPDDTESPGTLVSAIIARLGGAGIADPDLRDPKGLAITGVDNTHGHWQFTTNAGLDWSDVGTPSNGQALLLAPDAGTRLRFVPDAGFTGAIADAVTFRAWDQTSGMAGSTADTSLNGGLFAFSAAVETADVGVFWNYVIGTGHAKALIYTDADGTIVTLTPKGAVATVALSGGTPQQTNTLVGLKITGANLAAAAILLTGTTAASSLTITTTKGTVAGAAVGTIACYSPLGTLAAPTIDLTERLWVGGTLGKLALDDIAGPCTIAIGGSETAKTPVTMTFDQVADLRVDSATPIRSVTAAEWLNPTGAPSGITAPWVGSLKIAGRRAAPGVAALTGDFKGDLQLTSTAAKLNLGTMSVAGWLDGAVLRSTGPIGAVTAGGLRNSRILAGVKESVAGLPASADDFDVLTSIGSLTIRGIAGQAKGFLNSDVAAWTLGTISVKGVETTIGQAFGIVGHSLVSYTRDGAKAPKASAPFVIMDGQYTVQLI
jgi:6-phosphogluconolactonase (cycloisomerase 2 family)